MSDSGFRSKISLDDKQAKKMLEGIKQRLINPKQAGHQTQVIAINDIQNHFDRESSPIGRWTARKDNKPHKILTLSGNLRNGLKAQPTKTKSGMEVVIKPSQRTEKYAYIHNNGGRFRNRGGTFTRMPKRQYAWISQKAKEEVRNVWIKNIIG